jgi:hypothetical protein
VRQTPLSRPLSPAARLDDVNDPAERAAARADIAEPEISSSLSMSVSIVLFSDCS